MSSSREYVEAYIKKTNNSTEAYLAKQQPNYDASKTTHIPTSIKEENIKQQEEREKEKTTPILDSSSSHFNFHKTTQNPIVNDQQAYINNNNKYESTTAKKEIPTWTPKEFTDQRREIHDTALLNCSDLNMELMNCFQNGSWWDKAKMCEAQKQKFWSCFHSQKKFLKDTNYKGPMNTPQVDDMILMDAMKLRTEYDNNYNSTDDNKDSK
ncbi:unnamed protein product [Cunninghamella echinulata]